MADSAKVRLVRCPKCENLLPELADYSVYQCGGCGTVLRAKDQDGETSSPKSGEERAEGDSIEKDTVDSKTEMKSKILPNSSDTTCSARNDIQVIEKSENESNNNNNLNKGKDLDELSSSAGGENGVPTRLSTEERQTVERNSRNNSKAVRFSSSEYSKEGPSNRASPKDEPDQMNYLEQGRAEFFKTLNELKDQLSQRSYDGSSWVPRQGAGPPLSGSPYSTGYYSSMHNMNYISRFEDRYDPKMNVGGLFQFLDSHRRQSHPYHSRQYSDTNLDSLAQFHHNPILHQPSCTCYRCFEIYQQRVHEFPHGRYVDNSRIGVPPMKFRDRQLHSLWTSDFRSNISGFNTSQRPRRMLHGGRARRCRPVFSGAPFLACYNCFELLLLPKRVRRMAKNELKICCGACSTIIKFRFVDNKLVLSERDETKQIPLDVDNGRGNVVRETAAQFIGPVKHSSYNFSSADYDNSGYEFRSVDQDPPLQLSVPSLSSDKHVLQSLHCSSSSASEEEENSPDVLINAEEITKKFDHPTATTISPPPPTNSPLQPCLEHSSNNHVGDKFANGNRSSRPDEEKAKSNKVTSRQNSFKNASLVTEMEVPKNEYSCTVTKEYSDTYSVKDHSRTNKVGDSFFANIIKKSFRSNRALGKNSVTVNGHFIRERIIKKAEKLAGKIHPGEYWYDARAGFWGVMGGPCLGIIPPFIEELNYPMQEDCSKGNTGVFVNGRQLHQKDLELLSGRGLPASKGRSYIIEISGRLVDSVTGEEMDGLGRLAPTIEKVKHGFGMKVPRTAP